MAIKWLEKFEGTPEKLIAEFKGENSLKFKLMASFFLENRVLQLRTTVPSLLAAAFAVNDKKFVDKLLHEASILDVEACLRLMRQGTAGIGVNKRVRLTLQNWLYSFSGERLELEVLGFKSTFREVIELIHTHPDKFSLPWFQHYVFDKTSAPRDSLISKYLSITSLSPAERSDLIQRHTVPWTYLLSKAFPGELPEDIIDIVIDEIPFMYLIHYLDRLASRSSKLDKKLSKALMGKAYEATFNFGLVLKKYLHDSKDLSKDIKIALLNASQTLLNNARVPELVQPIFIIGDNSASMSASIEAAVLMSCILAQKLENCRLLFFNDKVRNYKPPKDINGIIRALEEIRANSSTAIAAAVGAAVLQGAKTIILVSDGGHNTPSGSYDQDIRNMDINPLLPGIDFYYLMVSGDRDRVWDHYKDKTKETSRLVDLKNTNVSFIFGFLKLMLQYFNYDPESKVWDQVEAIKGAFLPETSPTNDLTSKSAVPDERTYDYQIRHESCVICQTNLTRDSAVLLICGHRFHEECLKRYWELLDGGHRCVYNCKIPVKACVNCGAALLGTKCSFCGTEYLQL